MTWRLADIPDHVRGAWAAPPARALHEAPFCGVTIDSREVGAGEVFIALSGERVDGHQYIDRALDAGAGVAIANEEERSGLRRPDRTILVPDTKQALWALADAWRRSLDQTSVIAVTGSNGKTTTCRLIHAALSARLRGQRSRRSFNNDLGVPLTLLRAQPGDNFIVCEIGANAPGEIKSLGDLARPDIVVITSVGRAHVGGFGSFEAIVREKSSLASCTGAGGVVFAPDSPESLTAALQGMGVQVSYVGHSEKAALRLRRVGHETTTTEHALRIDLADGGTFAAPVIGRHNALNMALAVAVARRFGLDDAAIQEGLTAVDLPAMRQEIVEIHGVRVLNDAYNANPDSMRAAIATFLDLTRDAARRVLVLGDMLELGDGSRAAHQEILNAALGDRAIDHVVTVGAEFAAVEAPEPSRRTSVAAPTDEAMRRIADSLRTGDAVLLKGSRLMRLERLVEELRLRSSCPQTVAP